MGWLDWIKRLLGKNSDFTCLDPSRQSAATLPTCSKSCGQCFAQFLLELPNARVTDADVEIHDDKQASSEIDELISHVQDNIAYMARQIEDYGNVIATRWTKRLSNRKRKTMLLKAKPMLHPRKYAIPDMIYESDPPRKYLKTGIPNPRYDEEVQHLRGVALNPYLDVPSLVEDKLKLLAVVHYRATTFLSDWILFDLRMASSLCHVTGLLTAYNPHCLMLKGTDFGKLVQWKEDPAHRREMIGYPGARLALLAQVELTKFLRQMIDLILEGDLSAAVKGRDVWDGLAAGQFRAQSLDCPVGTYFESAFNPPPHFDAKHLANLFQARLRAAEDDLSIMQKDPLRFRDFVDRTYKAVQLSIGDCQYVQRFVLHIALRSVARLAMLRWIHSKLQLMDELTQQANPAGDSSIELSEEYWATLQTLDSAVKAAFHSEKMRSGTMIASSTAFQGRLKLAETQIREGSTSLVVSPRDQLFKTDKLMWNIVELSKLRSPAALPMSVHFASIDQIIADPSTKDSGRIDQVLYDYLSDLATVAEALAAISYHRHYKQSMAYDFTSDVIHLTAKDLSTGMVQKWVTERCRLDGTVCEKLEQFRKLPLPSSRISEQKIARMRCLHEALDGFWQEVRDVKSPILKTIFPKGPWQEPYHQYVRDLSRGLDEDSKAKLEEQWKKDLLSLHEKEASKRSAPRLESNSTPSNCTLQFVPWSNIETTSTPTVPKDKFKTRPQEGSGLTATQRTIDRLEHVPIAEKPEKIALDRDESLAVFERMFSRSASAQGTTKWPKFVAALQDAGLSATYHGGSAVIFSHKLKRKGAVSFHMPHPDSSIHINMLREMGKALNRWFCWDEDTFFVRSKQNK